jgi:hypothetical protein
VNPLEAAIALLDLAAQWEAKNAAPEMRARMIYLADQLLTVELERWRGVAPNFDNDPDPAGAAEAFRAGVMRKPSDILRGAQ